MHIYSNQIPH